MTTMVAEHIVHEEANASSSRQSRLLLDILMKRWEKFQRYRLNDSRKNNKNKTNDGTNDDDSIIIIRNAVTIIQRDIETFYNNNNNNNNEGKDKDKLIQEDIMVCLKHFFDCAIGAVVGNKGTALYPNESEESNTTIQQSSSGNTTAKQAIDKVMKLTAAVVACPIVTVPSCYEFLQYVQQFTIVPLYETVRAVANEFVGYLVQQIMTRYNRSSNNSDGTSSPKGNDRTISSYNDVLDLASQTLIPRFTDKSQIVRLAAINAGQHFFGPNDSSMTDPDILQAMLWSLQHDPSPVNRLASCDVIPLNLETIDYVLTRIRDVKPKVRCAALKRLHTAFSLSGSILDAPQAAATLLAGWTKRCSLTKNATRHMVCFGWMKAFNYNPIDLVQRLNVYENQGACEILVEILQDSLVASENNPVMTALKEESSSDMEFESFMNGMKNAYNIITSIVGEKSVDTTTGTNFAKMSAEQLFLVNSILKNSKDLSDKETLLAKFEFDIPTLCVNLEQQATSLVQSIQQKDVKNEEEKTFVCLQLLRLACYHQSTTTEEGSRRVFCAALKSFLSNILTPDDLVEGAVEALRLFVTNDSDPFINHIADIIRDLTYLSKENTDLTTNYILRILSILSVTLEKATPAEAARSKDCIEEFGTIITQNIRMPKTNSTGNLVQEAAVCCLGKLGILSDRAVVENEYTSALLDILNGEKVPISVQGQALLALCDFSILTKSAHSDLIATIAKLMQHSIISVACIAAEAACKLLLRGLVDESINSIWLARLLVHFFEQTETAAETEDLGDLSERGNPMRLQQLLSVFFPTLCVQSQDGQDALMGAIEPMLDLVVNSESSQYAEQITGRVASSRKSSRKTKRKAKNLPLAKMIEYICTNVQMGEAALAAKVEKSKESNVTESNEAEEEIPESSPILVASIQIADFLSKNIDSVDTTTLRSLCKILGGAEIDVEKEACEHLSLLKESMEDVGAVLEDETSLKYLQRLNKLLENLEFADDVVEEEDQESASSLHGDTEVIAAPRNGKSRAIMRTSKIGIAIEGDENMVPQELLITPTNVTSKGK